MSDMSLLTAADLLVRAEMNRTPAEAAAVLSLIPRERWDMVLDEARFVLGETRPPAPTPSINELLARLHKAPAPPPRQEEDTPRGRINAMLRAKHGGRR